MFWRGKQELATDWLVVGLGNPGEEYCLAPHNLGFMTVERIARDEGIRITRPEENALVGHGSISDSRIVLAKPLSFMNRSGGPVKGLVRRYKVKPDKLLVIYDELDLPWQSMRLKLRGSAAGHNGMKSIIESLGTSDFNRLRIGIHPGHAIANRSRYVLQPFHKQELADLEEMVDRSASIVRQVLKAGMEKAMAECNRRSPDQQGEVISKTE